MAKPKNPIIAKALWVVDSILPASGTCKVKTNEKNIVVTGPVADVTKTWKNLVDRLRDYETTLNEQIRVDSHIEDDGGKIVISEK